MSKYNCHLQLRLVTSIESVTSGTHRVLNQHVAGQLLVGDSESSIKTSVVFSGLQWSPLRQAL